MTTREELALQGIAAPVALDPGGRLVLVGGAAHDQQTIRRALSPCDCESPWRQGHGLSRRPIFRLNRPATWGLVRRDVEDVFRRDLADRFELVYLEFEPVGETLEVRIGYRNRVTDDDGEAVVPLET